MNNSTRRELLNKARSIGYPGNILEVFSAYDQGKDLLSEYAKEQQQQQLDMQVAQTPEEQGQGLRPYHEQGQVNQSMAFPNIQPGQSFSTEGMRVPINIDKIDNQGNLVESYKSIPPGIANFPTGPYEGTVIESPARMQTGGPEKRKPIMAAEELPEDIFPYKGTSAMFKDERYNISRAKELYEEDESGHLPSIDYETGEWLKAKRYPTSWKEFNQYALNPEVNALGFPTENNKGYLKYPNYKTGGPNIGGMPMPTLPQEEPQQEEAPQMLEQQPPMYTNMHTPGSLGNHMYPFMKKGQSGEMYYDATAQMQEDQPIEPMQNAYFKGGLRNRVRYNKAKYKR